MKYTYERIMGTFHFTKIIYKYKIYKLKTAYIKEL